MISIICAAIPASSWLVVVCPIPVMIYARSRRWHDIHGVVDVQRDGHRRFGVAGAIGVVVRVEQRKLLMAVRRTLLPADPRL